MVRYVKSAMQTDWTGTNTKPARKTYIQIQFCFTLLYSLHRFQSTGYMLQIRHRTSASLEISTRHSSSL